MTTRKVKTNEERLSGWMADPARRTSDYASPAERGLVPVVVMECYGMRYERFQMEDGTFIVTETVS